MINLFETPPAEISHIINKYCNDEPSYQTCEKMLKKVSKFGYTFEYGLDGQPYDLRKVTDLEKAINKYCKAKKNDLTYTEILECYKEHLNGKYHTFKVMDVIFEFKNKLQWTT
jgi:hypothetical protein